jgi:hypothetical protein
VVEVEAARFSPDQSKPLVLAGYMIEERITHFGVCIYLAGGHFDSVRPFLVDIEIPVPIIIGQLAQTMYSRHYSEVDCY